MPDSDHNAEPATPDSNARQDYVVVARRYRPQNFDELIGQQHVAQALSGAISANRVGHAYLFTGARGVGKTSAARILAKALNCEKGTSSTPCNECDTCLLISSGDDVDVLEIDGASERRIEDIRALRQNVNVRPSRSRFKIYIIDEVHMLTLESFNALLKTLEEPPGHVKFIFCTTEPNKIPITILSRCQRFDFAGIMTDSICQRLRQIVEAEGVEAEPQAIEVLARRAAGSMRDGQSLLEQLLAFATEKITLDDVHEMLGTAGDERLVRLTGYLVARDAGAALAELDGALGEGVDVAQMLEQLLGILRDCMVAAAGCPAETFIYASPASSQQVTESAQQMGLDTILAAMQIIDQALARFRQSTQVRLLAELALVRICQLEDLDSIPELIANLQSGQPPAAVQRDVKKNIRPPLNPSDAPGPPPSPGQSSPARPLTNQTAAEIWIEALSKLSGMAVDQARQFERVELSGANRLVVTFNASYAVAKSVCERPEQMAKFENVLADLTGTKVRVEFRVEEPAGGAEQEAPAQKIESPHKRLREIAGHPMVSRARELFGAEPTRVDGPPKPGE